MLANSNLLCSLESGYEDEDIIYPHHRYSTLTSSTNIHDVSNNLYNNEAIVTVLERCQAMPELIHLTIYNARPFNIINIV